MDKIRQEVVILDLLTAMINAGSWCGETHLQKSLYFLQDGVGVHLDLPYILYKHGPYSFDLHDLLGEMKANLLIELKPQPYPYGPSLVPTESGTLLAGRFPKTSSAIGEQVAFVAESLSTKNVGELEKICTALFISNKENGKTDLEIARQVVAIKPHIKLEEAISAVARVRELTEAAKH